MRSNDTRRNVSGFARMTIRETDDDYSPRSQGRNDEYPPLTPTVHYSKSSIIRIKNGWFLSFRRDFVVFRSIMEI